MSLTYQLLKSGRLFISTSLIEAWQFVHKVHQDKHILLITHVEVIPIILAYILGIDTQHSFRLKIGHACISQVQCIPEPEKEGFFQLIKHG